ncbi:MAG: phosphate signaling complex protein PhoU [Rhizobiaceae bacterium]|nr:phosphate signaling complex protein PhoU [Rhizobiaceae bacterium]
MERHTVSAFDQELNEIDFLIREMAGTAAGMVEEAIKALLTANVAIAQRVISEDAIMDTHQRELDDKAITLIGKRQPLAQDLRTVLGAIRMGGDLERIGDLAKNIAKRVSAVGGSGMPKKLSHGIDGMSALVLAQIGSVVEFYVARDGEGLRKLRDDDEKIDISYTAVFRELLTYMMEDPRNITACTHLLFCAKNLERIGDHVTNVAEIGYFIVTGEQLPTQRPKYDETTAALAGK